MTSKQSSQAEQSDPHRHVRNIQGRFQELIDHLRSDIEKIEDARAKAMFETSAEVLGGLKKAFRDYEAKNEAAWR